MTGLCSTISFQRRRPTLRGPQISWVRKNAGDTFHNGKDARREKPGPSIPGFGPAWCDARAGFHNVDKSYRDGRRIVRKSAAWVAGSYRAAQTGTIFNASESLP